MKEGRAGGQDGPVSQETGGAHLDGAVAQEAPLALGTQGGQQLLGVLGELHHLGGGETAGEVTEGDSENRDIEEERGKEVERLRIML